MLLSRMKIGQIVYLSDFGTPGVTDAEIISISGTYLLHRIISGTVNYGANNFRETHHCVRAGEKDFEFPLIFATEADAWRAIAEHIKTEIRRLVEQVDECYAQAEESERANA